MEGKKTKGKQKIEMKLIENTEDKLITFSKRRSGINKKASELVTLTGAELAFVVFSPAGKPYSFGHPSVESVVRRYLGQEPQGPSDGSEQIIEAHQQIRINDLNNHHNKLIQKLEADNQKMKELKARSAKMEEVEGWWETPIEDLSFDDLVDVNNTYKEIFAMISTKMQEKTASGGASTSSAHLNPNNPNLTPLGNNIHLQMSGPSFEAGAGSGGGGDGPSFEAGAGSGGGGGLPFEATDGNGGGGGPPIPNPASSDVGYQWGAF